MVSVTLYFLQIKFKFFLKYMYIYFVTQVPVLIGHKKTSNDPLSLP